MNINQEGNVISILLPKALYSQDVLFKCFYWYTGKYNLTVDENENGDYLVRMDLSVDEIKVERVTELKNKIKKDLIDFKLRDIVTKETRVIRELLVAKAFAFYDSEEIPESSVSDPIGFSPLEI